MENWEEKFDEIFAKRKVDTALAVDKEVEFQSFMVYPELKDFIRELIEPKKPDKRNPEIQSLWEYGLELGLTETKQNLQRFALKRLLSKQPPDKLRIAAEYAASIKSDRYAPQVNSWLDLEEKYLKLRDYVARQKQNATKTINLDVL